MRSNMARPSGKQSRFIFGGLWTVFVLIVCIIGVEKFVMVETRTVPRPSSGSVRFPTSHTDEAQTSQSQSVGQKVLDDLLDQDPLQRRATFADKGSSIPRSASLSETEEDITGFPSKQQLSAEILEADSIDNLTAENMEDESLRHILCSTHVKSIETNLQNERRGNGPPTAVSDRVRYDLRAGKCGEVDTKAHCGNNMIFVAEIDSGAYGYCECDFENKMQRKAAGNRTTVEATNTPLVFHSKSTACYHLYQKAYCQDGEWLVLSRKEKGPVCEARKCSVDTTNIISAVDKKGGRRRTSKLLTPEFWTDSSSRDNQENGNHSLAAVADQDALLRVPLNGNGPCVVLNSESHEFCGKNEIVTFNVGEIVPTCQIPGRRIEGRATIVRNACPPGSFYSIIGRCQPDWDF